MCPGIWLPVGWGPAAPLQGPEATAAQGPLPPLPPSLRWALVTFCRSGKPLPSPVFISLFPKEGRPPALGPAQALSKGSCIPRPGVLGSEGAWYPGPAGSFWDSGSLPTSRASCHLPSQRKGLRARKRPLSLAARVPQPWSRAGGRRGAASPLRSLPTTPAPGDSPPLTAPRSPQHSRGVPLQTRADTPTSGPH